MARKNRSNKSMPDTSGFNVNPFDALDMALPEGAAPEPEPPSDAEPVRAFADAFADGTAIIRLEKKGRAGKAVTIISGGEESDALDTLGTTLRKHLSTGGNVVGDEIVIQGDQRRRAAEWLQGQGVKVRGDIR